MTNIRYFTQPFEGGGGEFRTELEKMFKRRQTKRNSKGLKKDLALIGILFARPSDPFARENIIPELDYFNSRSAEHIDLFCVGYSKKPRNPKLKGSEPVVRIKNVPWWFDNDIFNNVRQQIEEESRWEYSGQTELLLANARSTFEGTEIDYSSAIPCKLEEMEKDKAIKNVREFFENVIRYAEDQDPENPAAKLSDKFGKKIAMSVIKKVILTILLRSLASEYDRARPFVLTDFSKKS